ncbi:MAG: bifunctional riboflavin kinase/FMN adenylyltransferase [Planctomycetota bacterium]
MGLKPQPSVLTLGNFDGPHVGHRAILRRARELAAPAGASVVAVTFDPPPVRLLRPGAEPPQITTIAERTARLRDAGADAVEVLSVTPELLGKSAEGFVADLVERFAPVAVVEGPDFRFGHRRAGDMDLMAELGKRYGFTAVVVPPVEAVLGDQTVQTVSSSLVRWLVGRGRVEDAAACLGRPFALTAEVVKGEQRGRTIGVPTANLDPNTLAPMIVPADGVYAAWATVEPRETGEPDAWPAAVSIGVKPTFGNKILTVEAHLIDVDDGPDLYGRRLTLRFARWLRDQYPFPGVGALRAQLGRDIDSARRVLTADRPPPGPTPGPTPGPIHA